MPIFRGEKGDKDAMVVVGDVAGIVCYGSWGERRRCDVSPLSSISQCSPFDEGGHGEDNCRANDIGDNESDGGCKDGSDSVSRCEHWLWRTSGRR